MESYPVSPELGSCEYMVIKHQRAAENGLECPNTLTLCPLNYDKVRVCCLATPP